MLLIPVKSQLLLNQNIGQNRMLLIPVTSQLLCNENIG